MLRSLWQRLRGRKAPSKKLVRCKSCGREGRLSIDVPHTLTCPKAAREDELFVA